MRLPGSFWLFVPFFSYNHFLDGFALRIGDMWPEPGRRCTHSEFTVRSKR